MSFLTLPLVVQVKVNTILLPGVFWWFFVQDYTQFIKRGFIKHKYDYKQCFVRNVSQQTQNQLTLENINLNAYIKETMANLHWVYAGQGTFLQKFIRYLNSKQRKTIKAFIRFTSLCNAIKMQNGESFKSTVKRGGEMK